MQIEFNSPPEEFRSDLSLVTWSPPNSPGLYNFLYSQSEMIDTNNSSYEEFLRSPSLVLASVPKDESICFGTLSQLEELTEFHDPWRFIKLTTFAFLIPPRELLHGSTCLSLIYLTRVDIIYRRKLYYKNSHLLQIRLRSRCLMPLRFDIPMKHNFTFGEYIILKPYDLHLPCLRELKVDTIGSKREYLIKPHQFYWTLHPEPVNFANGTLEQAKVYHLGMPCGNGVRRSTWNSGSREYFVLSYDAVSGTVTAERNRTRRKCEVPASTSSGSESALKHIHRHHEQIHWPIIKTNKDNQFKSEAKARAFNQSSDITRTRTGGLGSIFGLASFSRVALEPDYRNEYDVSQSEPCLSSFVSPLASKTSTRRLFNNLLVRLRRISWSAGDLSDLELKTSYQLRSTWNNHVNSFMLGPCYPQNTTNRLLFEFTFIIYSQIEFLLFQASMMQQNIPPNMTAEMIVGVKELEILDDMLEAILNVQPMLEDARTRLIKGEAVKAWLKEVIHIFYETLGLLTDCRTEIKNFHIEKIHECSTFHIKIFQDFPCWLNKFTFKSEPISNKFHEILMLSNQLIKVNHLFLNFSKGYLVEPNDFILDPKRTPRVSREVVMTMVPSSLEQSLMEDKDDLTRWDVGSSYESLGEVGKPHDDSTLQSIQTPEIVMEMEASDSLQKPTREEAIDKASSSQSLAAITAADKQCKGKRSSKKVGIPTELITDVNVLVPYSSSTEQVAADGLRECSSRNQASSSQSFAANSVADKQCKRKRSSKKCGRPTKLITDVNVLVPYSSSTEQVAADSLRECSSRNQPTSSQSLAANTLSDSQRKRKRSSEKGGRPTKLITDVKVLLPYSSWTEQAAADDLGVGKSTLKRSCRRMGINDWSKLKEIKVTTEAGTSTQPSLRTSPPKKAKLQDSRPVTVKATYRGDTAKLRLFSSSKKVDLDEQLARKLKLEVGGFKVKHVDEENEEILVSTDSDFEDCIETSESQGNRIIRLRVEPITT